MSVWPFILKAAAGTAITIGITKLFKGVKTQNIADKLKSEIVDVNFKGFFGSGLDKSIEFGIKFRHTNAQKGDLFIKNMFLDLYLEGSKIGSIRKPDANIKIEGEKVTQHWVYVRTRITEILGTVWNIIKNGQLPSTIYVKGFIMINDFRVEFNETYPLKDESNVQA